MSVQQKMFLTATATSDGSVRLDLDFFPKLPTSEEEFAKLSDRKKSIVAIINHIGKVNERMVQDLIEMETKDVAELPVPEDVSQRDSGSETSPQLPSNVSEAKDEAK